MDGIIDQAWARYSAQDHAIWHTLFERQARLLPGLACDAFVRDLQQLPLQADRIPDCEQLSEVLLPQTGWRVVAVPGPQRNWTTCKSPMCFTTCSAMCRC